MAEKFGKTWWGQQWLRALNNIDFSNRLPRGATYARRGSVTSLEIKGSRIHARVKGSRPSPYKVDIILPGFEDPERRNFLEALSTRPLIISRLFNRELAPELLSLAEDNGLQVFPEEWSDLEMSCSCPDWAVPCKHLAAAIYKICSEIDNNPFLAFRLHHLDLIEELSKRGLFIKTESATIPEITELYIGNGSGKNRKSDKFELQNAYQKLSYSALSPIHEALYALLPEAPPFYAGSGDFKKKYKVALNRAVKSADRIINGRTSLAAQLAQSIDSQTISAHTTSAVIVSEDLQTTVQVNGETLELSGFMLNLAEIPGNKLLDYQPSTAAFHTLFHLAMHLTANGGIVPQIIRRPDEKYAIRWLPSMISKEVRQLVIHANEILPPDVFWWETGQSKKSIEKDNVINLLSVFITELVTGLSGKETRDLFLDLFFTNLSYSFDQPGERALVGGIQAWLQKFYLSQGAYKPQLAVSELSEDEFRIDVNVVHNTSNPDGYIPLKNVLNQKKYDKNRIEILQSIATLTEFIPGLEQYIRTKGKDNIILDNPTFTSFLFEMIPVIRLLDIDILLPRSLRKILKPRPSVSLTTQPGKSYLRLEKLLNFDWKVAIGDTVMSESEFKKLLKHSDGLLKYKSQYIYVNQDDLEKLHKHFNSGKEQLSSFEMLRAALIGEYQGASIDFDQEVRDLIQRLTEVEKVPLPTGLKATLRPYQERGYSWMYRNARIGFGSVLADDMGLGKTVQVIATLLKFKEEGLLDEKKSLIILPTGLLTNWQAEIEKFAPSLTTCLYHGTGRKLDEESDIVLTSYGIARSEAAKMKKMPWFVVVIDEAQNIKNQNTKQTRAIKSIKADHFIAMSGTPVENRLSELWSILDYSNRGVLGSDKDFQKLYGKPIETYHDKSVAEKLKKVTAPFIMRRLKTDKSIISDLPDKIEIDSYGTLVAEQASLYQKTVEEAMKEIEAIDPADKKELFTRQGLVLQMIIALKQICNHPAQYLKNKNRNAAHSGKIQLLFDKLDAILDSGEKVLVFTQFREMGELLQYFIEERYQESPMFYHGGSSLKQRKNMVHNFQTNPADKIFILSLKAAGTGLNLTAAQHVIHYDLWWNPAVEIQATDRAYRIGQKNDVMVHRFITKNTFEERINAMIQSKKTLAEMTVSTGENWIGNLSNTELKGVFEMK